MQQLNKKQMLSKKKQHEESKKISAVTKAPHTEVKPIVSI